MKRFITYISFIFLALFLYACFESDPPKDDVLPTPPPQELTEAIESMQSTENFRLDITFDMDFVELKTVMLFDGQTTYYELLGEVVYLNNEAGICYQYKVISDQMEKTVIDCEEESDYGFYKHLEDTWFVMEEQVYHLKNEHYEVVNSFVRQSIPEGVVSDFALTLSNNRFQKITFTITALDEIFYVEMVFSQYNKVSIRLPEVE